jgi:hypothetical protein
MKSVIVNPQTKCKNFNHKGVIYTTKPVAVTDALYKELKKTGYVVESKAEAEPVDETVESEATEGETSEQEGVAV